MAIVYPVVFTAMDDQEYGNLAPVSEEAVRKLVQNVNLLGKLAPVGSIRAIAVNSHGVPPVNSDQFQFCDGGEITNGYSPLQTTIGTPRYTPKLNDKYLRGAADTTTNNDSGDLSPGGTLTRNLSHSHGGNTQPLVNGSSGQSGSDVKAYDVNHFHSISSDLSSTDPIDMAHVQTAYYLKIN